MLLCICMATCLVSGALNWRSQCRSTGGHRREVPMCSNLCNMTRHQLLPCNGTHYPQSPSYMQSTTTPTTASQLLPCAAASSAANPGSPPPPVPLTCCACLLCCLPLSKHSDAQPCPPAVRQQCSTTHHLVTSAGVYLQPQVSLYRLTVTT